MKKLFACLTMLSLMAMADPSVSSTSNAPEGQPKVIVVKSAGATNHHQAQNSVHLHKSSIRSSTGSKKLKPKQKMGKHSSKTKSNLSHKKVKAKPASAIN